MAAKTPNSEPQFVMNLDKNGNPLFYTKKNEGAPMVRLGEKALFEANDLDHDVELDRAHFYNMGIEDAKVEAKKINVTTSEDEPEAVESHETSDEKLVPASDYKEQHSVETEDGFPIKGLWEGHAGDQPVTVEKSYGVGGDGQIYYKISESATGVPADQLKFYVSGEAASLVTDEALPESPEKEKGKEDLRREAIDPERILELKDEFEREFSKELELHNIKTDEDKQKDPWLVKSSAEHIKNKILREYLKIVETDWDAEELAEVRQDVLSMMELSQKTLENLMLKPLAAEAPVAEEPIVEPAPIEPGPTIVEPGPTPVEPGPTPITPEPVSVEPTPEPIIEDPEEQRKGILARLRDKFRNGRTRINTLIYEGLTDKEKIKKRRWAIIGLMGASAVAGALGGILGYEAWEHMHHHNALPGEPGNDDIDKHLSNIDKDIHHLEQQQQQHNLDSTHQHTELSDQHHDLDDDLKNHNSQSNGGVNVVPDNDSVNPRGDNQSGAGGEVNGAGNEDYSQYQYPWDWADKKFGESNSMPQLHHLADIAKEHGHKVEWNPGSGVEEDGSRAQILSIDGTSDAASVIKILNGYVNAG